MAVPMLPVIELGICRKSTAFDYLGNGFFESLRTEQRLDIACPVHGPHVSFVLEYALEQPGVLVDASINIHAQSSKHDCNEPWPVSHT